MSGLHTLKRPAGLRRSYRRVGRGQSSTRGKTSGRGGKGQTARAGAKIRPEWRDIIKKLPKLRGWGKNRRRGVVAMRPRPHVLSLVRVEKAFDVGEEVNVRALCEKGFMRAPHSVKIVGNTPLTKKFVFRGIAVSRGARAAIEGAGGTVMEKSETPNSKSKKI